MNINLTGTLGSLALFTLAALVLWLVFRRD